MTKTRLTVLLLAVAGCAFLLSPARSLSDPSQNRLNPSPACGDIQDYLDTIDQAGLYDLLDQISHPPPSADTAPAAAAISALLADPPAHRGQLISSSILLDRDVTAVSLDRQTKAITVYYVAGQIPFAPGERIPAIVVLPSRPKSVPLDVIDFTGYFYMILRAPTQQVVGQAGADYRDFLVFVSDQLPQSDGSGGQPKGRYESLWLHPSVMAAGAVALWIVWRILRRRTRKTRLGKTLA